MSKRRFWIRINGNDPQSIVIEATYKATVHEVAEGIADQVFGAEACVEEVFECKIEEYLEMLDEADDEQLAVAFM